MVDSQLSIPVDNLIANNLIVHNLESFTCGFMFLNLHQDTRSSNSLRIHNNLSSHVQCHCPSCLLTTPLGSNHMQKKKKKKKYCIGLGRELHWYFLGSGASSELESKLQPFLPLTSSIFMWSGLVFSFSSTPTSQNCLEM